MTLAIQLGHRRFATTLQTATHNTALEVPSSAIEMDVSSPLGVGAYGAVYKGSYNGRAVAIKTAANASCTGALVDEVETMQLYVQHVYFSLDDFVESLFMIRCNSPYVLSLIAVADASTTHPKLVLEYMDAGDLRSYLDAKLLGQPTKVDVSALEVAWVLANALADMHHNDLLHRDLKSHNVLLCSKNYIKLADLGIAREHESNMTTGKGTPYWTAPEVLNSGSHYSFAADIYAFGVILTELDTLELPFHDVKDLGYWKIMDGVRMGHLRPTVRTNGPRWLRDVANACLAFDPTQRPSAQMLVSSLQKLLGRSSEELVREPETEPSTARLVTPTPEIFLASLRTSSASTMSTDASRATTTSSSASVGTTTSSSWSNSVLVSTRIVCQACTSSATKLKVLQKRLSVAQKNGVEIDTRLLCVCCNAWQTIDATICDVCEDDMPDDDAKLRILVQRIAIATKSAA
ncbi:TKL protein kinase [Saprolegnia parasitica CBS 223.65]|uniref:TKL protein kinase n=1 Tax=Saprolegnia parasitica (strain CBS 223.65) TaxID=695850 RepID=A0A067BNA8_SAPPC|nr:TKL protein kinase [Saprolegnia parasitica CBS 223.65]KDO18215.1 TKL protein kinase [Saprolegnia parasitica CBS 223.65]|eukprot:XP_012211076.1 TKL protein kinase [Saprolegnia parasitica CBS 223.65]